MTRTNNWRSQHHVVAATVLGLAAGMAGITTASATPHSTVTRTIAGGDRTHGYATLHAGPGRPYVVREDLAPAHPRRAARRRSLVYVGQLTDLQLADEESPARLEALDPLAATGGPLATLNAAWRPQEALGPQVADRAVRQLNRFRISPLRAARGRRARMALVLTTGDAVDNQQRNETQWVVRLLEGGRLDPNSGSTSASDHRACPAGSTGGPAEAARYTGVQDVDDSLEGAGFYDPDEPAGAFAGWPRWPGLMDRAQQPFVAAGLDVPSYVVLGNHDALVQGNLGAGAVLNALATGCVKPMLPTPALAQPAAQLTPGHLAQLLRTSPGQTVFVPPDPNRRFVSRQQYRGLHFTGRQADGHGFGLVDADELAASAGTAAYYGWSPRPGLRFIGLDTTSGAGIPGESAEGNIDAPQFAWLRRQLDAAVAAHELVVLFGHHPIRSLTASAPDEVAPPCPLARFGSGRDQQAGCDADPRRSSPIGGGTELQALLLAHPNVVAFVAGHTHENHVTAFRGPHGTGFWGIETASEADWPQQSRLVELMDNRDGTLSIFGTSLDTPVPAAAPPAGDASGLTDAQLASISRELAYNDPQLGGGTGEGARGDGNVELLLRDPRR